MSLVSNIFNTSSYKPKEKKKSGLTRFADTISAPFEAVSNVLGLPDVVGTLAKPAVEAYAGIQQLRGKETSRWVKEHGLQTPETAALMTKGATDENLGALVKKKKAEGYKGAGATDILNVASLAPGLGTFAKGSKALGSASKVASGAERFLPTLGRTLKETVPAGAAWGSAYGAAGAYDQGGDIGEGALVGGLTGAAVGGGLGLLGASVGSLANKASRLVNKDLRAKGISDSNLRGLTQLEDNNGAIRKVTTKHKGQGIDSKKLLSQTDLLVGAVDDTGTLRTTQEGGAISQLQDFIKPQESVVSDILKREGKTVNLKDVEKSMIANLDASNISGEDLIKAQNKIKREISGLRRRADKEGNLPMWRVQDAKTYKYGNIDYLNPGSKNTDKLIARTFKEIIEQGTESADIRALNKELQAHYSVLGLLERLDGKKVQGGKLGKYFAQTVGSIVGSHFGPLGSIVGAEIGGRIRGAQLQSQFGKAAGKGMERSKVLLDAMDLAQKPKTTPELIPESRRLPAPAMTTPTADTSGLLSQEEARAKLRSYGVTVDDLAPQSSKSLGSLNTSQSKTMTPTSIGISKSVAETPKVDINSVESLDAEITRRLEAFRSEAGIVAQREGAGVKMVVPDNGLDTANTEGFKKFSLNQAKGTMKAQAESAKKYAQTMLYENDPEFRSLVDMKDALLETKIVDAKTVNEAEKLFGTIDNEVKTLENEISQYEKDNRISKKVGQAEDIAGEGSNPKNEPKRFEFSSDVRPEIVGDEVTMFGGEKEGTKLGGFSSLEDRKTRAPITGKPTIKDKNLYYIKDTFEAFGQSGASVGDIIDFPELSKAYPNLTKIRVEIQPGSSSAFIEPRWNSQFDDAGAKVILGVKNLDDVYLLKRNLFHELQHYIQYKESFAKGGSPDLFFTHYEYQNAVIQEQLDYMLIKAQSGGDVSASDLKIISDAAEKTFKGELLPESEMKEFIGDRAELYYRRQGGEIGASQVEKNIGKSNPESGELLMYKDNKSKEPKWRPLTPLKVNKPRTVPAARFGKDSPLLSEAKRYKTADSFVKAQGEPIYHGTMSDFQEFDTKSPTEKFAGKAGTYFTSNSGEALGFGKNVKTVRLVKDAKIKTIYESKDKTTQMIGDAIFAAKREGYDAIVLKDVKILRTNRERFENAKRELPEAREKTDALVEKMLSGEITMDQYNNSPELQKLHELQNEINPTHTIVFNNDKIKTQQQLLDIYKKAHGEGTGVPKSSLVVKETPKRAEIVDTAKPDYIKDIKVKIYKIASDRDTGTYEREILNELSKNLDKMPLSNFKDYVDMIRKSEVNNYIKEELTNIIKSYSKKADDAISGAGSSGKSRIGKLRKK